MFGGQLAIGWGGELEQRWKGIRQAAIRISEEHHRREGWCKGSWWECVWHVQDTRRTGGRRGHISPILAGPKGILKGFLWYGMKWNQRIWAEESHALTYIVYSSSCPVGNRLKVARIATWRPKESLIMTSERCWWLGQGGHCGGGKKRWDFDTGCRSNRISW